MEFILKENLKINNPKDECVWHFINGSVVKGEFIHEIKEIEAKGKEK